MKKTYQDKRVLAGQSPHRVSFAKTQKKTNKTKKEKKKKENKNQKRKWDTIHISSTILKNIVLCLKL
jgi:hypothetical protein